MIRTMRMRVCWSALVGVAWAASASLVMAQAVGLPSPRLLTTMPMGGQVGTDFEVTISGDFLEEVESLNFSHPGITATAKLAENGSPVPNQYVVRIAADTPIGLHEARVMTRLGVSSSRIFSVGTLPELVRDQANTNLDAARELAINTACDAFTTARAVDHYVVQANQGQRLVVDCAARGIDSKLNPVLIVADALGRDLVVERRGGTLDFTPNESGKYVIKVHDLTFQGGPAYFYRLVLRELPAAAAIPHLPTTQSVSAFSWPPTGLAEQAATSESEPNNGPADAQKITLPCDIAGSFYPAADVDTFEFMANKGDVWWVEVASERLGLPTDPAILVQHVRRDDAGEVLTDVAELTDIPSPVRPSSNGYAYDGPPYNGGSTDILAKLEIKEDGLHRLQLRDLFGGTRNDPRNVYRLIIRRAEPDFALVAWAMHMELRNGDRNALSKPLALRGGATMALEVVAIRRDGFDGPIDLAMEGLPPGVTASGLRIPSGQAKGLMLITAREDAPRGLTSATFVGRAEIEGQVVTRPCRLTSMAWPVPDHWQEIPSPRLLADVPVSVSGTELAPLSIGPQEAKVWEVTVGEKLTIPLTHTRRSEFSGATMGLKTFGGGFENVPRFDVSLNENGSTVVLDTAALKKTPGDYLIAFYGSAVAKYRHNPFAVLRAEADHKQAELALTTLTAEAKRLAEMAQAATDEAKSAAEQAAAAAEAQRQAAQAAVEAAAKQLKLATDQAQPKDIVDIIVSEPISIRITAGEVK